MDRYRFGEFIYQKRKAQGLTQEELGRRLGVTNKAVSKWEVGETTPDITILEPLAVELKVTVGELLSGKELEVEEKKKLKLNKALFTLVIVLGVLELLTLIILCSGIIYNNYENKKIHDYYNSIINYEDKVELTKNNVEDYMQIYPLTSIQNNGQTIKLESLIYLKDGLACKDNEVILSIDYTISYYYTLVDGSHGVVTYARSKEGIVFNDLQKETVVDFELTPKTEISDYVYLNNVIVTYEIRSVSGVIYK